MVADVRPYEHMKLRLLNGSHSTLAYLGYLAGYETVSDVMADAAFARLVRDLMDEEVTPTLPVPPGADLAGYKRSLQERFANPALKHRTWQIAMDGSQKLPQRLVGTIRDRLAAGAPFRRLARHGAEHPGGQVVQEGPVRRDVVEVHGAGRVNGSAGGRIGEAPAIVP